MNVPDQIRQRWSPPHVGVVSLQFTAWWCTFYVMAVLLALVDGFCLRHLGLPYRPKSSFDHVGVGALRVAPDGRWAVAVMAFRVGLVKEGIAPDVVLYDFDLRIARRLDLAPLVPRCVAISPQGDALVIASDREIYVATCSGSRADEEGPSPGVVRLLYRADDAGIQELVFSPDGRQVAALGIRYVHWLSYPEGEPVRRLTLEHPWAQVTFSRDSRHLLVLGVDRQVNWYDRHGGRHVGTRSLTEAGAVRTVLSPTGRLAAHVRADGGLSMWDLEADRELWRHPVALAMHNARNRIDFSPDGRLLAVACGVDESFQVLGYDALTGVGLGRSARCAGVCKGLVVTDDGLVYVWDMEGMIRVWNLTQGIEQWRFAWPHTANRRDVPLKDHRGLPRVVPPG